MLKTEVIVGSALMAVGIRPAIIVIVYLSITGTMPPSATFGPTGLTGHDEGCAEGLCSRVQVQFTQFLFAISFFMLGIGTWFLVSGLKSVPIIGNKKT